VQLENCPRSRIEVRSTALGWCWVLGLGLAAGLELGLTLTFNEKTAIVMTHTHAKGQGQRSIGSKDRVETDGQTEAIALPPTLTRSVKICEIWGFAPHLLQGIFQKSPYQGFYWIKLKLQGAGNHKSSSACHTSTRKQVKLSFRGGRYDARTNERFDLSLSYINSRHNGWQNTLCRLSVCLSACLSLSVSVLLCCHVIT